MSALPSRSFLRHLQNNKSVFRHHKSDGGILWFFPSGSRACTEDVGRAIECGFLLPQDDGLFADCPQSFLISQTALAYLKTGELVLPDEIDAEQAASPALQGRSV